LVAINIAKDIVAITNTNKVFLLFGCFTLVFYFYEDLQYFILVGFCV